MKVDGLKPPPRRAPRRLRSTGDLRDLQRLMMHVLVRPLTAEDGLQTRWVDGRPMEEVAAEFMKPNDRLTAFERLEIYNRMYWFRLIDCVYGDNPGLRALLGERRFSRLVRAYLAACPSRSFTLRNLCARLSEFIRAEPRWTAPKTALAAACARFEWAQTVAFDSASRPVIQPADLAAAPPDRLRLSLQPYITLLTLDHALDAYVIAVKKRDALRAEASNAPDGAKRLVRRGKRVPPPRRGRIHLAVHRRGEKLYYKRLELPAFRILEALRDGRTIAQALAAAGRPVSPGRIQDWFSLWTQLGWLCPRKK